MEEERTIQKKSEDKSQEKNKISIIAIILGVALIALSVVQVIQLATIEISGTYKASQIEEIDENYEDLKEMTDAFNDAYNDLLEADKEVGLKTANYLMTKLEANITIQIKAEKYLEICDLWFGNWFIYKEDAAADKVYISIYEEDGYDFYFEEQTFTYRKFEEEKDTEWCGTSIRIYFLENASGVYPEYQYTRGDSVPEKSYDLKDWNYGYVDASQEYEYNATWAILHEKIGIIPIDIELNEDFFEEAKRSDTQWFDINNQVLGFLTLGLGFNTIAMLLMGFLIDFDRKHGKQLKALFLLLGILISILALYLGTWAALIQSGMNGYQRNTFGS